MTRLKLENLVAGLEQYRERYQALDVFIEDVDDLNRPSGHLRPIGENSFLHESGGNSYRLDLFPKSRVARLTRVKAADQALVAAAVGAFAGAAAGAVIAKPGETGRSATLGALLGVLVGAAVGAGASGEPTPPRRIFTLRFDADANEWRAYDGNLVRWVKGQLAPPEVLADMPS